MKAVNGLLRWIGLLIPRKTSTQIDHLKWDCGSQEVLGVNEVPAWRDWTDRKTTPDQARIEEFLKTQNLTGKRLLHVGVGNSELARSFCPMCERVDGITIQRQELERGRAMEIPNYRVLLMNKFSSRLSRTLSETYDYIVDNNPTSYTCCRKHFFTMLKNYKAVLKPGGMVLTDKVGLAWTCQFSDEAWGISIEDWFAIGACVSLKGKRIDDHVVGLKKSKM